MVKRIDFFGIKGTPMRAVYLSQGETSPRNNMEISKEATIEFYDLRYPHTSEGQYISGYYAESLLEEIESIKNNGLDLMGYVDSWKIDSTACKIVLNWLDYLYDKDE